VKEQAIPLMLSIIATLLNYIFISSITNRSQALVITDLKQVMNFMLNEIKENQTAQIDGMENAKAEIINEIKEATENKKF
jgi:transcription antitermination factor NusG